MYHPSFPRDLPASLERPDLRVDDDFELMARLSDRKLPVGEAREPYDISSISSPYSVRRLSRDAATLRTDLNKRP